ncbi:unnamed protein product [Notodromas monacha]|uniref:Xaa-Pro dipeptidase n=1 Tax=Notodromas monacha TaxID=399045 RepID=A0A7R9GAL1_9CRUS|nr:unnamed protein product [Notodromas monacha]CAG0913867.1 unnamed protein product [Notodromas monacha]
MTTSNALSSCTESAAAFTLGAHTLSVSLEIHAENRQRLVGCLWQKYGPDIKGSFVLLCGGTSRDAVWYASDAGEPFKQECFFHWAFGVLEPDWLGGLNVDTGKSYLFMPKQNVRAFIIFCKLDFCISVMLFVIMEDVNISKWRYASGRLLNESMIKSGVFPSQKFFRHVVPNAVDEVLYLDEIVSLLNDMVPTRLLTLRGRGTDSEVWTREAQFEGINKFFVDNAVLHRAMVDCRVRKVINYVIRVSKSLTEAKRRFQSSLREHLHYFLRAGPMMEYHLEAIFKHHIFYYGGMRRTASICVCGSGPNASILRYGNSIMPNDRLIRDGDLCLLDMGGEYYGYASDISLTFPINGIFSEDQKAIYNAVLRASKSILSLIRPGVSFPDMHRVAERVILEDLIKVGILKGDLENMWKLNVAAVFMPHGVGHLLGLDVHDVGGYAEGTPPRPQLDALPGIYFIDALLDAAIQSGDSRSSFFDVDVLPRFRGFGGVRIEDDVVVTSEGCEVLTASIPRSVADIETVMAEGRKLTVSLPEPLCSAGACATSPTNPLTSS